MLCSIINKDKERWEFRVNRNGNHYWINPDTFITRKQYPFLKEVKLRVNALKKTLIMTAFKKKKKLKSGRKGVKNEVEYMVKPSLLLRPEEINEVFATPEGHDLYQKVHKDTEERTKSLLIQKMLESRAPNTIKEVQEKEESDTSEKNKMINSQVLTQKEQVNLLYTCPFRFEKSK